MADKEALLASIAQAGTAGKQAYLDAQARLAAQQEEAVRMALSGALVANAPPGMREQLTQTISAPYQSRIASLTQNQAGQEDYFNRIGTNAGVYADQVNALGPALRQQYEQALALKMADSGGGGGGGGGDTSDPFSDLLDTYHGKENLIAALPNLARPAGVETADYAEQLGVPPELAASWFPRYATTVSEGIPLALTDKKSVGEFRDIAKTLARQSPGNQLQQRRQFVKQYKKIVQRKKRRKQRKTTGHT